MQNYSAGAETFASESKRFMDSSVVALLAFELNPARKILEPEVEKFFKAALQHYVREEYREAIELWDKGLLMQP